MKKNVATARKRTRFRQMTGCRKLERSLTAQINRRGVTNRSSVRLVTVGQKLPSSDVLPDAPSGASGAISMRQRIEMALPRALENAKLSCRLFSSAVGVVQEGLNHAKLQKTGSMYHRTTDDHVGARGSANLV